MLARGLRIAALAVGVGVGAAAAAPAFADNLAGDWLMETSVFDDGCKITGKISFKPSQLSNSYSCSFESVQACNSGRGVYYIRVKQTCTAQKVGRQVAIKSTVASIEEVRPAGSPIGYYADNFVMAIQKNLSEMLGDHYDEARELKARFWREEQLIS